MRRASHERTAQRPSTSVAPTTSRGRGALADRKFKDAPSAATESHISEVLLSPSGTFTSSSATESDAGSDRRRQLAIAIRQRIESRLHGRVRNLLVKIHGQTVVLEGQCATYYSKQLAQHCALGILENEQLENLIVVGVAR
jgi:hypothetical protein